MKKKVLIIEDDPCIRMLLLEVIEEAFEDSLDDEKLEIFEASNGEQGLQMALKERPDLIFSDVMMPKMDGFEVCRKIKNDPDLKGVYFILLTAKGQEVDKEKGATAGCDEYMTKPFKPELIVSKVEERLSLQKND
ncbi:MAG: response regulator [Candidatus Anammoxibacter sp.]